MCKDEEVREEKTAGRVDAKNTYKIHIYSSKTKYKKRAVRLAGGFGPAWLPV